MFKLEFRTDTVIFEEYRLQETIHCLRKVIFRLESDEVTTGVIRDLNGNTIGHFELTENEHE